MGQELVDRVGAGSDDRRRSRCQQAGEVTADPILVEPAWLGGDAKPLDQPGEEIVRRHRRRRPEGR